MNISPEEAQAALASIQDARLQLRKMKGINGYFLIIWGIIWFTGFLSSQFLTMNQAAWVWGPGVTLGWILSAVLGIAQGRRVRSNVGVQHGYFYLALIVFAVLWMIILQPLTPRQTILYLVTLICFGGLVSGILMRILPTIIGCLVTTLLACLGYYLLPGYFYLWMALLCGLPMTGMGIVMRWYWR